MISSAQRRKLYEDQASDPVKLSDLAPEVRARLKATGAIPADTPEPEPARSAPVPSIPDPRKKKLLPPEDPDIVDPIGAAAKKRRAAVQEKPPEKAFCPNPWHTNKEERASRAAASAKIGPMADKCPACKEAWHELSKDEFLDLYQKKEPGYKSERLKTALSGHFPAIQTDGIPAIPGMARAVKRISDLKVDWVHATPKSESSKGRYSDAGAAIKNKVDAVFYGQLTYGPGKERYYNSMKKGLDPFVRSFKTKDTPELQSGMQFAVRCVFKTVDVTGKTIRPGNLIIMLPHVILSNIRLSEDKFDFDSENPDIRTGARDAADNHMYSQGGQNRPGYVGTPTGLKAMRPVMLPEKSIRELCAKIVKSFAELNATDKVVLKKIEKAAEIKPGTWYDKLNRKLGGQPAKAAAPSTEFAYDTEFPKDYKMSAKYRTRASEEVKMPKSEYDALMGSPAASKVADILEPMDVKSHIYKIYQALCAAWKNKDRNNIIRYSNFLRDNNIRVIIPSYGETPEPKEIEIKNKDLGPPRVTTVLKPGMVVTAPKVHTERAEVMCNEPKHKDASHWPLTQDEIKEVIAVPKPE